MGVRDELCVGRFAKIRSCPSDKRLARLPERGTAVFVQRDNDDKGHLLGRNCASTTWPSWGSGLIADARPTKNPALYLSRPNGLRSVSFYKVKRRPARTSRTKNRHSKSTSSSTTPLGRESFSSTTAPSDAPATDPTRCPCITTPHDRAACGRGPAHPSAADMQGLAPRRPASQENYYTQGITSENGPEAPLAVSSPSNLSAIKPQNQSHEKHRKPRKTC